MNKEPSARKGNKGGPIYTPSHTEDCIFIGVNAGCNATTASSCVCIGDCSGLDIVYQHRQARIGNFTGQRESDSAANHIIDDGNIVITPEVKEEGFEEYKKGHFRIGKFSEKEKKDERYDDCYVFRSATLIVFLKKKVAEMIIASPIREAITGAILQR